VTRLELPSLAVVGIRAANPGAFTLSGTNSWVVGSEPAWVVDPGPGLSEHLDELTDEINRRGGLGGIVLTHDHPDHADGVPALRLRFPGTPLAAGRGPAELPLADGAQVGPLEAIYTPGHAPDHFAFAAGDVLLTGDAVLGEGSVFISPDRGALAGYLEGLAKLRRREAACLAPGHGPPVHDPAAKLDEYVAHRLDRERRLVAALTAGARSVDQMLAAAWDDVPDALRPAATVTLAAHLDKLADEGRLPAGVERPEQFAPGPA
jgi:glyoxylase-like metal-dependent hydrolase (beta-lactamase superfamily II)